MAKVLAAVFAILLIAEVVIALVIAGVLFWLGSPQTIGVGLALVVLAVLVGVLTVRFLRSGRTSTADDSVARGRTA
ncbi:hypothetical protein SAMN05660748_1007 [Blastococcus aggregatus]|uniref:Uncharacterized protein n=1 Tax=Blastococcus aggregatus TaxID=38502 RepID=A0A285V116_9ACTN|nr:hypothetical protein [Blastococcus aggregatus]SOC47749.1 hypothetical protein SAMN05660748_1007 [Blastococcus aggregatus]